LDAFIDQLPMKNARVVELGAGSCDHAFRMAKEKTLIKEVTAVEYSETAVNSARKRLANLDPDAYSRLIIECNDLFTFLNKIESNTLDGIYANSVLHFLTPKQRQDLYCQAYKSLVTGGIIAVSFKTMGDATDYICRLFVSPTGIDVLSAELQSAGFNINSILQWCVADYNIDGDDGQFLGFVATR